MVSEPSNTATIDQAINRILAAEREGRADVARCAAEAEGILADAQARAERIRERTEARVQLVHRIADRCLEKVLGELHSLPPEPDEGTAPLAAASDVPDEVMDDAVARLVDELIGPPS
ncbi:hypothetical protein Thimo_2270 [Thioflavicoccus mobilis 8321]|uniref:Uncharacterized protein n=1 Tax=Thioflavicoccus mobilis 8321 TaxID=765912 RepID=L0H073_9GAMM|nr:hypothetical protein [Thioflavicoccus mobilis]AGA91015.1 hypothetical protein Thimo_2270 [Thioflavicoccus mobilis 8321]